MATWKKVIVSGSDAHLASVTASVHLAGTNQVITTNPATTTLSGSFSGSFSGNGSGLTGIIATTFDPATARTDITSNTTRFFISQSTGGEYITYGNLLTDLAGTNLAVEGTDSLTLATTITGITSITSTGFTGSLQGTASWASNATNAISAATASKVNTTTTSTNATFYVPFVSSATGVSDASILIDSGLQYNPGTDTVTIAGDLVVSGTTTTVNTNDLLVEDQFILIASGSTTAVDAGIMVDRGTYQSASVVFGFDAATERWGFQNGLADSNNAIAISNATASAFVGLVLTQGAHGASKPTAGEFVKLGTMYIEANTAEDIWIYS